ncbi:hypothetical protein U1Q18_050070 [Sarracenia purpurea var. burkii]
MVPESAKVPTMPLPTKSVTAEENLPQIDTIPSSTEPLIVISPLSDTVVVPTVTSTPSSIPSDSRYEVDIEELFPLMLPSVVTNFTYPSGRLVDVAEKELFNICLTTPPPSYDDSQKSLRPCARKRIWPFAENVVIGEISSITDPSEDEDDIQIVSYEEDEFGLPSEESEIDYDERQRLYERYDGISTVEVPVSVEIGTIATATSSQTSSPETIVANTATTAVTTTTTAAAAAITNVTVNPPVYSPRRTVTFGGTDIRSITVTQEVPNIETIDQRSAFTLTEEEYLGLPARPEYMPNPLTVHEHRNMPAWLKELEPVDDRMIQINKLRGALNTEQKKTYYNGITKLQKFMTISMIVNGKVVGDMVETYVRRSYEYPTFDAAVEMCQYHFRSIRTIL